MSSPCEDVPLEFVRKVARARAVAEAGHVKSGAVTRHGGLIVERSRVQSRREMRRAVSMGKVLIDG